MVHDFEREKGKRDVRLRGSPVSFSFYLSRSLSSLQQSPTNPIHSTTCEHPLMVSTHKRVVSRGGDRGVHDHGGRRSNRGGLVALIADKSVSDGALEAPAADSRVAIGAQHSHASGGPPSEGNRAGGAVPRGAEAVAETGAGDTDTSKAEAETGGGGRGGGGACVIGRAEAASRHHVDGGGVVGHLEGSEIGSVFCLLVDHGLLVKVGVDVKEFSSRPVRRSGLLSGNSGLLLAQASAPTTVTSVAASPTTMAAMAEASKASVQTAVTTPSNDAASVSVSSDTSATDTSATMRTTISGTTVTRASVPVALQLAGLLALLGGVLLNCLLSRGRGRGRGLSGVQTTSVPRASSSRAAETVSTGTAKCTSTNTSAAIGRGAVHRADVGGASVGGLVDSRVASLAAAVCIATETSTTHGRASRTSDSVSSEGVATDASRASHPPRSSPELPLRGCFKFCLGLCHRNLTRD
mmetsp:Transcript_26300/g.51655  ORF Transcript_26300/g.51655 Transcript_26300/m.51655 type:complete len:466 (+) Transcript_26300:699-2096(+)